MKKRLFGRILSFCLLLTLLVGIIIPLTTVNVEAKRAPDPFVSVPASSVGVSKTHAYFTKMSFIFNIVNSAIKGAGAFNYASENYDGSVDDFLEKSINYFTGNADEFERIDDLEEAMLESFRATNGMIGQLRDEIDELKSQMQGMQTDLKNTVEYTYLKGLVDKFYSEDYFKYYDSLKETYGAIETMKDQGTVSDSEFTQKMDLLYSLVLAMEELPWYLTGKNNPDGLAIIDAYCEYVFKSSGVNSTSHAKYVETQEKCQDFALRMLAADALYRYCLGYVSAYHLNYIDSTGAEFYLVDQNNASLPATKSYKIFESDARTRIAEASEGVKEVWASLADTFANLNNVDAFAGYTEGGTEYYAPIKDGTLTVYNGADYHFYSIPSELVGVIGNDLTFKLSGSYGDSTLSETGNLTVSAQAGSSFTVSYVFGKNITASPTTVYEINITVADRKFDGGYGNAEAPYLIGSADQFNTWLKSSDCHAKGVYTKLTRDVDLTGVSNPGIENFYGSFDGGDHTVSGITSNGALFSINYGIIRNVTLKGASIYYKSSGIASLGGITDINEGHIENCHVADSALEIYMHNLKDSQHYHPNVESRIGAIAGQNKGVIRNSSVVGTTLEATSSTNELYAGGGCIDTDKWGDDITSYTRIYIGGIAGESTGEVTDTYVGNSALSSETKATYYKSGGLWAYTYNRVSATVRHGATVGLNSGTVSDCLYYNVNDDDINHAITKKAAKSTEDSFVTSSKDFGVKGTETERTSPETYLEFVKVNAHPFHSSYKTGTGFNHSGLEVVDNNGNSIYGFTVSDVDISSEGVLKLKVSYLGKTATLDSTAGCMHETVDILHGTAPTCKTDGTRPSYVCHSCGKTISGGETISASTEYCPDENGDHKCDLCTRTVSVCDDVNYDHKCDLCGAILSTCTDDNNDHRCELCNKVLTPCYDEDDHFCDICLEVVTSCYDDTGDHLCEICGKTATECEDYNNDHLCDICNKTVSECKDETRDHLCDICNKTVSFCSDKTNDHLCDLCGEVTSYCGDHNGDYLCDVCNKDLCSHNATDNDHFCNICTRRCSECKDETRDHLCDICEAKLSNCSDTDDHYCDLCDTKISECQDRTNDHKCDLCNKTVSVCEDILKDHRCDVCDRVMTDHTDANSDHICDWCTGKASDHIDSDDHKCDICFSVISACKNTDTDDHLCDTCSKVMSECSDPNKDHKCDVCAKTLSICSDELPKDHLCDTCGATLSAHIDANADHVCEYCGTRSSDHTDSDDHLCDICYTEISKCADKNSDHKCDVCLDTLSRCNDKDSNHYCDTCETRLTPHSDEDEDGECDVCSVDVENHEDEDGDGLCDICGDEWEPWQMPWWGIMLIVFGIFGVLIGGFLLIYWISEYC